MAAAAGGDAGAGIGSRLRAAREKKGLTVLQAAERMHVDSRILEALESEDFASLGASVYAKGHLRHYAELLDEQAAELIALYSSSTRAAPAQPDLTRISRPLPDTDPGKLSGPAVVAVVTIAIVGSLWWFISSSGGEKPQPALVQESQESSDTGKSNTTADTAAADQVAAADTAAQSGSPSAQDARPHARGQDASGEAAAGAASANAAKAARSAAQGGQVAKTNTAAASPATPKPTSSAAARPGTPPAAPGVSQTAAAMPKTPAAAQSAASPAPAVATAATAARATPISTTSPNAPPTAASGAPLARPNPTAHAKDAQLTLKFSSDSWAEVYDAAGQRLFYDVGAASTAHTVKGSAPLRVVLGNAAGVALEYNGRPAPIPSGVLPDGSVRFVITARGRTAPATDGD